MLKYDKEDYPQYRFAEIINRTPDAKILTYDVMDSGYYLASGTMPSTPYFCYLNIENTWPVILNEQNRLIAEGLLITLLPMTQQKTMRMYMTGQATR